MRRVLIIMVIIALLLPFGKLQAQGPKPKATNEIGFILGGSYYIGDLSPNRHFRFTRPAGGLFYRHAYNPRFALRYNLLGGMLYADDAKSKFEGQKQRNLSFRSLVAELSAQAEFNFVEYEVGNPKYPFSPYIFVGIGAFYFEPKAKLNDEWERLRPLGTEGQGTPSRPGAKKYVPLQVSIPFGIGIKANLSNRMGFTLEWGLRKTFTDYIDDVSKTYPVPAELNSLTAVALSDRSLTNDPSITNFDVDRQRGNERTKDWYSFVGIMFSIKLGKESTCPSYH